MYIIDAREMKAVQRVIGRRKFFRYGGTEVVGFEREWAAKVGTKTAIAVSSGTAALVTALGALGLGPGDEVLVPAYTFVSTALAVTSVGAIPVYVEVDDSLTLDPRDLERKLTPRSKCVIPVHMQGMPCDLNRILRIARKHGLRVLEDCCQADGGSYRGKRLGAWGHMAAYSFNQYKIISCGEGGAVVTDDKKLSERAFMLQDGSCSVWPETGSMSEAFFCAGNFRFNEINAAILRVQVRRLDGILAKLRRRRSLAMEHLQPPPGFRLVPSHDEKGNCGVCFLLQGPDIESAVHLEKKVSPYWAVHRPIDSGRHVYSAWNVVNERIGGHHPAWDCFQHPANRDHLPDYSRKLTQTDDLLARTLLFHVPYEGTQVHYRTRLKRLDQVMEGFR